MAGDITPDDREKLCDALKGFCLEYGTDEVQEALADVLDAIHEETGELSQEELEAEDDATSL